MAMTISRVASRCSGVAVRTSAMEDDPSSSRMSMRIAAKVRLLSIRLLGMSR